MVSFIASLRSLRPFVCILVAGALLWPLARGRAEDQAPPIPAALKGRLVGQKNGSPMGIPDSDLAGKKYYALYFSAGWCQPCHLFTPRLVAFYQKMHARHPEFEVVFISSDESEIEMQKYMKDFNMPWPALRFWALKSTPKVTKYGGMGIPRLVLVDPSGAVLSDSFKGTDYIGPDHVIADLQGKLGGS